MGREGKMERWRSGKEEGNRNRERERCLGVILDGDSKAGDVDEVRQSKLKYCLRSFCEK
jgi:hypothetical protein